MQSTRNDTRHSPHRGGAARHLSLALLVAGLVSCLLLLPGFGGEAARPDILHTLESTAQRAEGAPAPQKNPARREAEQDAAPPLSASSSPTPSAPVTPSEPPAPASPLAADAPPPAEPVPSPRVAATAAAPAPASPTGASAPAASDPPAKAAPKQRLFGTVEFKGPLKNLPEWQGVLQRNAKNPIFTADSKLNSKMTWGKLKEMLQKKTPLEQIRDVNSFWNQWPYRLDKAVYGKEDYWAAPYEFRKNSGDCEDYSIVKYFTLKELGFKVEQMRIVVLKDSILNLAHAVLAVYLEGEIYILDNLSKNVLPHSRITHYHPQYSVNEENRWVHVKPK